MFDTYRTRMSALGSYEGEYRRKNSQNIIDASWMRDAATKPVYVKWVDSGLPVVDDDDPVLYAKFNVKSYHNITGDEIAYLLQFRQEDMKFNKNIRVGSYVQIMNEMDEPEWWLIVHYDDRIQFRQFSILKCAWIYKWVSIVSGRRVIYQCLGAPRKQNSYNSGVWLDHTTQTVENQEVMWLPTNNDTKTIQYDTKFLKSSEGRYPPIKWSITKIEDTAIDGISRFTMAQGQFDSSKDNAELMIADYYQSIVTPETPEAEESSDVSTYISDRKLEITYSGQPAVRAGGGYKKFTLKTYDSDKLVDVMAPVEWEVDFTDGDLTKLEYSIKENIFKVKCLPDYSLIGKTFTISAQSEHSSTSLICEVISL